MLSYAGYLLLALLVYQVLSYLRTVRKILLYSSQGVTIYPNAYVPILGNLLDLLQLEKETEESEDPVQIPYPWMLKHFARKTGMPMFDGKKHPLLCINFMGDVNLFISDPVITQ